MAVNFCAIDGCDRRVKARGWCQKHYRQWQRGSEPGTVREWAPERRCEVCGATNWAPNGLRSTCSKRCHQMRTRHPDGRPSVVSCAQCGVGVSLLERTPSGRQRRVDVRLCRHCRYGSKAGRRTGSPSWLAQRDGPTCGVCGRDVDLALRRPDPMSVSVDHIVPRSQGGTDDPENLQLAHLVCNQRKNRDTPAQYARRLRKVAA